MEDTQIVGLFWDRSEQAIWETEAKYGRYCYRIAYHILHSKEDSEESVSDTYLAAWQRIPPHKPGILSTFLGKLTRRISLNRWRSRTADKRGGGEVLLALEELSECIPYGESAEREVERKELAFAISHFLDSLPQTERDVFVSRYWFLAGTKEISGKFGFTESKVKSMLFRIRGKLRHYLTEEGFV